MLGPWRSRGRTRGKEQGLVSNLLRDGAVPGQDDAGHKVVGQDGVHQTFVREQVRHGHAHGARERGHGLQVARPQAVTDHTAQQLQYHHMNGESTARYRNSTSILAIASQTGQIAAHPHLVGRREQRPDRPDLVVVNVQVSDLEHAAKVAEASTVHLGDQGRCLQGSQRGMRRSRCPRVCRAARLQIALITTQYGINTDNANSINPFSTRSRERGAHLGNGKRGQEQQREARHGERSTVFTGFKNV